VNRATVTGLALTVLCVDDEPNILNSLRRVMRAEGYRVLTAESGAEALALMDETSVDLVLSDMRMPEMDGAQFLAQVKSRWPDTARILLTGYAELNSTIAAINNAEIYRYISKPWNDAILVGVVRDALERRLLQREKEGLERLTREQNRELKALNETLEGRIEARTAELASALESLDRAHEKLKKSFMASIRVFANLIELREGAVAGHSRHVAELARRLAHRLKLPDGEVQDITLAGLLHGIGEFGLADELLRKPPAALSAEEREKLSKQPLRAQTALMGLEQLAGAAKLIRSYRERFDGSGYPDHLAGLAIPLGARVLSVAHDFEAAQEGALTGRWLSKLQAREYIVAGLGSRYDPAIVEAFLEQLEEAGVKPLAERRLPPSALEEGMVTTRDLVAGDGLLLLSKETVLTPAIIEQLLKYVSRDSSPLFVDVCAR
jgi:response regulator RpfG family c-di-GMP phosphodiesterase